MTESSPTLSLRPTLLAVLLTVLALLCAYVVRPFLVSIVWAVILAYVTWPLYRRVHEVCGRRQTLTALLMTLLVVLGLIGPILWLAWMLPNQLADTYEAVQANRTAGVHGLPPFIRNVPWLGDVLQHSLDSYAADPLLLRQWLIEWAQRSRAELLGMVGDVGRNLAKLLATTVTLYFLYRHGVVLVQQSTRILSRFFGNRLNRYLVAAGAMTRAVVYGLLATALAQGLLAGLGYWAAGVRAPIVLAVLTALIALIPFGAPLVWGLASVWLLYNGAWVAGLGLLAWGALVVSSVDNVIRPLVISGTTRVPFLLVMFGVLGGLAGFGMIGLFVGPILLAVATAVWREWLEEQDEPPSAESR